MVSGVLEEVKSAGAFTQALQSNPGLVVCHFWASWSDPCKLMSSILLEMAKEHATAKFLQVEAEEVHEVSEQFNLASVPFFVFFKGGKPVDTLDGADAPALYEKINTLAGALDGAAALPQPAAAAKDDIKSRIKEVLGSSTVLLFMKGNKEQQKCGFSRRVVEALNSTGVEYSTFDILEDEAIRQGLKEYSNWPTYPQLYVKGELMGGCDIIEEMHQSGELKAAIQDAAPETKSTEQRIKELLGSSAVLLFMKGNKEQQKCGFSRRVVEAINATGLEYSTFDILEDEVIRQGLKEYSNWPTYPQLYVKGELMGGCDIIEEMHQSGELKPSIEDMMAST